MTSKILTAFGALILGVSLVGCDVDEVEKGRLPKVDVDVKDGKLPKYDVTAPDINVHTEKETITVPDVDINKKEVEIKVPKIDVDIPAENDNEPNRKLDNK